MYLVMEYCSGGDLAAFIKRCKRVSEPVAHHLMRQVAAGLQEMWAHNLVHVRLFLLWPRALQCLAGVAVTRFGDAAAFGAPRTENM